MTAALLVALVALAAIATLALLIVRLLSSHAEERTLWAKERNLLNSRIQTPQIASSLAHTPAFDAAPPRKLHVGFDNDREFELARDGEPLA